MVELARFFDLFSQLGLGPRPGGVYGKKAEEEAPRALPQTSEPSPPADVLEISRVPSNSRAASFDQITPKPVEVAGDGTYRPTAVQAGRRFGMAFDFEFNLSVSREATFVQAPDPKGGGSRAILRALESTSLAYQSSLTSYGGDLGGSFGEVRRFQTEVFYSRTRELSARLDPALGQQVASTGRRVARTFELNISLEVSFLGQFTHQVGEISSLDSGLLEQYLQNTDGLAERSGADLQAFFDDVGRILQETGSFLQETLGAFFREATETFGLNREEADALQALVSKEVAAFFEDVDRFLEGARAALGRGGELPEAGADPATEAGVTDLV